MAGYQSGKLPMASCPHGRQAAQLPWPIPHCTPQL